MQPSDTDVRARGKRLIYRGLTTMVTGASGGLGESFARRLAAAGSDLVLVARSTDELDRLAGTLRARHDVAIAVMPADLSEPAAVERLIVEVKARDLRIDLLINNAGFGIFENFLDAPFVKQRAQIDVNVRALVSLTHAFLPGMVAARRGGVINIASTSAFQPLAGAAIYAATKAFVLSFSEAIALEVRETGVTVTAACPGPVATSFFADMKPMLSAERMDRPDDVVRDVLRAFERRKSVVYPGKVTNYLGTLGARLLPRAAIVRLAVGITRSLNRTGR